MFVLLNGYKFMRHILEKLSLYGYTLRTKIIQSNFKFCPLSGNVGYYFIAFTLHKLFTFSRNLLNTTKLIFQIYFMHCMREQVE